MARQPSINYASASNEKGSEDSPAVVNAGAIYTKALAAGADALNLEEIKQTSGRLVAVLVTTAGTAALLFYDSVNGGDTATATVIGIIPATATVTGVPFTLNMPAAKGIFAATLAGTPAVTVSFT